MFPLFSRAQVVITEQDMPRKGDTIRYSEMAIPFLVSPGEPGTGRVWDYRHLVSSSQYLDRFIDVSDAGIAYSIMFGLNFAPSYATIAKTEAGSLDLPEIPGMPGMGNLSFQDIYNFYHINQARVAQKGFGGSFSGFPLPVTYREPDFLLSLPAEYGNVDSSNFRFNISIPSLGYYGRIAKRINYIDGEGILKLPFGEFEALRIKSVLNAVDTIAIDTLGGGLRFPVPTEIKYRWIAKGMGWPLLEMTVNNVIGFEVVSRLVYRDNYIPPTSVSGPEISPGLLIYPNPAREVAIIECERLHGQYTVELLDASGRVLYQILRTSGFGLVKEIIPLNTLKLSGGIYFVKLTAQNSVPLIRPLCVDNQ